MRSHGKMIPVLITASVLMAACAGQGSVPAAAAAPAGTTAAPESPEAPAGETETAEACVSERPDDGRVYADGPFGQISVEVPEGWECAVCPVGGDLLRYLPYGLQLKPVGSAEGCMELGPVRFFGVCGTGLSEQRMTIAGKEASVGTYDGKNVWDFVVFKLPKGAAGEVPADGAYPDLVAQTFEAEGWSAGTVDEALGILDTMVFDPEKAQGGIWISDQDSEAPGIAVIAEVQRVTDTGITLKLSQYDALSTGEIIYGEDYVLQKRNGEAWEDVPTVTGDYGFEDIGHTVPADKPSVWTADWEWLYGRLAPGEYRIVKSVLDHRAPGDNDTYEVKPHFLLAGGPYGEEPGAAPEKAGAAAEPEGEETEAAMPEGKETAAEPESEEKAAETEGASEVKGINAVYPEQPGDGELEAFLIGDEHYKWWEEQRKKVLKSSSLQDGMSGYYADVLKELLVPERDENTVCSPLNIYIALAMLAETTDGEAREQILGALHAESIGLLRTRVKALWEANYADTPVVKSLLADSIWLRDDISYKEETLKSLAENYYASSFRGRMGTAEIDRALREWTDENTGGLLKEYTRDLETDPATVLALISTIYYKAAWEDEFREEETTDEVFHGSAGDRTVPMMHRTHDMYHITGDSYTAVTLPLNDSGGMTFFLPKEGTDVSELVSDEALIKDAVSGLSSAEIDYTEVELSVPRFKAEKKTDLLGIMEKLGITDVLRPGQADFSPLTDEAELMYVDRAEHTALVEADENGVTGAAYTVLMVRAGGAMIGEKEKIWFTLDRPFVFAVTARDGSVLFAGVVQNIE